MRIWTVVVNYRTAEMTLEAVESLTRALREVDGEKRTVVVDNDSQDGSWEELLEGVQRLQLEQDVDVVASGHNGGYGFGNNVGIRLGLQASPPPDYFYILNSDAFPAAGAVQELVDYLDQHREVGIAGSYIRGTDGRPHQTAFRFPTVQSEFESTIRLGLASRLLKNYVVALPIPDRPTKVEWLAGASMMIRRELLEQVGLFDEGFFLYFEEVDLCRRAQRAGWETHYVPASVVAHVGSASTGYQQTDRPMPSWWFESRKHYFTKNHGRVYLWAANLAGLVGMTLGALKSRLQRQPVKRHANFFRDFVKHNFLPRSVCNGEHRK